MSSDVVSARICHAGVHDLPRVCHQMSRCELLLSPRLDPRLPIAQYNENKTCMMPPRRGGGEGCIMHTCIISTLVWIRHHCLSKLRPDLPFNHVSWQFKSDGRYFPFEQDRGVHVSPLPLTSAKRIICQPTHFLLSPIISSSTLSLSTSPISSYTIWRLVAHPPIPAIFFKCTQFASQHNLVIDTLETDNTIET